MRLRTALMPQALPAGLTRRTAIARTAIARTAAAGLTLLAALAAAYALKRFYAGASAEALRFILGPTTWLVEVAGGYRFDWTSQGYLSAEHRFLIAPVCAGVNFLLVAFVSLVLGSLRATRPAWRNLRLFLASGAAAAIATVLANALRILIAIPLAGSQASLGGLDAAKLHELVGVLVFLGTLLLLHLAARRLAGAPLRAWVAVVPYAGVLLVAPLLGGAWRRPEFWGHAALVAGALLPAALAFAALRGRGAPAVAADVTDVTAEG